MFEQYDITLIIISLLAAWLGSYTLFLFNASLHRVPKKFRFKRLAVYTFLSGLGLLGVHYMNILAFIPHAKIGHDWLSLCIALCYAWLIAYALLEVASRKSLPFRSLVSAGVLSGLCALGIFGYLLKAMELSQLTFNTINTMIAFMLCTGVSILSMLIMFWAKTNTSNRAFHPKKLALSATIAFALLGSHLALDSTISMGAVMASAQPALDVKTTGLITALALICLFLMTFIVGIFYDKLSHNTFKVTTFKRLNSTQQDSQFEMIDMLTGLPNRHSFAQYLETAAKRTGRIGHKIALAYIDLDHFKPINDQFGHHTGDQVLIEVAKRLNTAVRSCDIVSRVGGDEFVALIDEMQNEQDLMPILERIVKSIREPFYIAGNEHEISCSVGVAIHQHGQDLEKLMVNADAAMYKAKQEGKNQYRFFDHEIEAASDQMQTMQRELRLAIIKKEFVLHMQPIVNCNSQAPYGAEVLLRWNHPKKGLLNPADFLAAAEQFGLIQQINDWVLEESCRMHHRALLANIELNLSINLSKHQFRKQNLVADLVAKLKAFDISPNTFTFEVAEVSAIKNQTKFRKILAEFRAADLKVAIDDFGMHAFSLANLKDLDVDTLKLDKEFIGDVSKNKRARDMVDALVRLAHALGMQVLAEGVETPVQRKMLAELGCDYMQGYHFSKPLPEDKLFKLFQQLNRNFSQNGHYIVADYNLANL